MQNLTLIFVPEKDIVDKFELLATTEKNAKTHGILSFFLLQLQYLSSLNSFSNKFINHTAIEFRGTNLGVRVEIFNPKSQIPNPKSQIVLALLFKER